MTPRYLAQQRAAYSRPVYRITLDGSDITHRIAGRLISLTLTDNRGAEADQLDLAIADHDGLVDIPPHRARLRVAIGWSIGGLVDKGVFVVDETEHSGAPDTLTIRARSADLNAGLSRKRDRSWHQQTLGDIVRTIAEEHGIQAVVGSALEDVATGHLDQAAESDINLLTRLGELHDAIATVKDGRLLLMPKGQGETAGGLTMPHFTITRADGDSHRYQQADRDSYSGVVAAWHDSAAAQTELVVEGEQENAKRLRHAYASRSAALLAARSEWQRLQREGSTLSLTLAHGRPELMPETTVSVSGFKPVIDGIDWLCTRVSHQVGGRGFTTAVELEVLA